MATVKQDMKRFQLINGCQDAIRLRGAKATITLKMPGTMNNCQKRRISAKGPWGEIIMYTNDGKKVLATFEAAPLLASMEVIRRGYITG